MIVLYLLFGIRVNGNAVNIRNADRLAPSVLYTVPDTSYWAFHGILRYPTDLPRYPTDLQRYPTNLPLYPTLTTVYHGLFGTRYWTYHGSPRHPTLLPMHSTV